VNTRLHGSAEDTVATKKNTIQTIGDLSNQGD